MILWAVLIFQYVFTTWIMIISFEGIFIKFDNAGIEGNLAMLFLFLIATFANGLSVFMFGKPEILKADKKEVNLIQRLKMQLSGYIYVGDRQREDWRGSLPFYRFNCPVHGLVENYPAGYEGRLECPECAKEGIRRV